MRPRHEHWAPKLKRQSEVLPHIDSTMPMRDEVNLQSLDITIISTALEVPRLDACRLERHLHAGLGGVPQLHPLHATEQTLVAQAIGASGQHRQALRRVART